VNMDDLLNQVGRPRITASSDRARSSSPKDTDHQFTVCHVLHTLQVGGGEALARAIALKNAGEFRPVFALLDELGALGEDLLEHGMTVTVIGRHPGLDFGTARRLRRFFRQEEVAVIHAHQYGPLLYSALARLPRLQRVWANRLLLAQGDRLVAVGDSVRQALIDFEGLPEDRIEVIYNGCDLSQYDPGRPLRSLVRSELGLKESEFVVIQVARLDRLKDLPTALRVARLLVSDNALAKLVIVGDGEDRPQLERLTQELQLGDKVLFLGSRPDVARLLQAADAFMLSSISEGIPLTLIEAMASGLPCVATRVGGVPEVISDGETGFLEDAGDYAGLAAQLLQLASNPGLRQQFGMAGRRHVVQQHDASMMHSRYVDLYREMAGQRVGESDSG